MSTPTLKLPGLEAVYDALAQAIDQAGPERTELLLVKLALFAAMLGLAALHRWRVVPRLEGEVLAGGGSRSLQTLRLTVTIEATLAVLIIAAVSILGTLNPHG